MKVCRICANSDENKSPMLRLFDKQKRHLLKYIEMFTGILLTPQIGMPEHICDTCLQDLERVIKFRKRCIKTQKELSRKCNVKSMRRDKKVADDTVISFPIERRKPECQNELINISGEYDNLLTETIVQEESFEDKTQNELNYNYDVNVVRSDQKTADGTSGSIISFPIEQMSECPENDNSLTETTVQEETFEDEIQDELNYTDDDNSVREVMMEADESDESDINFAIENMSECQEEFLNTTTEYDNSLTEITVQEESSAVVPEKLKKSTRKIDGPVVCEICGKSFNFFGNFRIHQLRHSGIKNFGCPICTIKFYTSRELSVHMRRHTGERPYACKYCDRRFSGFSNRTQHEKRHVDERRFKCEGCDKSFVTSECLKNHMLTHTGVRSHCCTVCDQWFLRRTHLSTHLRSKAHKQKLALQEQNQMSDNEK